MLVKILEYCDKVNSLPKERILHQNHVYTWMDRELLYLSAAMDFEHIVLARLTNVQPELVKPHMVHRLEAHR